MSSHCLQAQAEDSLGRDCLGGAQSATLKRSLSVKKSLRKESETDSAIPPQYSAMSEHSLITGMPQVIREWLMSCRQGSPVSPFLSQESARGGGDDRNMWPATKEVIRIIHPQYVFLENVPGLLGASNCDLGEWDMDNSPKDNLRYFGTILADLAEIGFDARWTVLGADDVGAPHRRKRLWVMADSTQREDHQ